MRWSRVLLATVVVVVVVVSIAVAVAVAVATKTKSTCGRLGTWRTWRLVRGLVATKTTSGRLRRRRLVAAVVTTAAAVVVVLVVVSTGASRRLVVVVVVVVSTEATGGWLGARWTRGLRTTVAVALVAAVEGKAAGCWLLLLDVVTAGIAARRLGHGSRCWVLWRVLTWVASFRWSHERSHGDGEHSQVDEDARELHVLQCSPVQ